MTRIVAFLLAVFVLACDAQEISAEGFRLDLDGGEFRNKVNVLSVNDLSVGQSGYIAAYAENFCRSPDSTVHLFRGTLLTEPSKCEHRWDITKEADDSISLNYQVGTEQADVNTDLVWAIVAMYHAEPCQSLLGGG